MIQVSTMLPFTLKVPTTHSTITIGTMILAGMRAMFAKSGIANTLRATSITLPRYMLPMRPHANSGFCVMSNGPG
jgi:hypothetical protein